MDSIVADYLVKMYRQIKESNELLDLMKGDYATIQIRLSAELIDHIDILCKILCVKRMDFIRHCIASEVLFDLFNLKFEKYWFVSKDGKEYIFDISGPWIESMSDRVKMMIYQSSQRGSSQ